jgi:hypothetical protein
MEVTELAELKLVDADKLVQCAVCSCGTTDDPVVDETPSTI